MQVEATVSGGTLTDVVVHAAARGKVGSIDLTASTFTMFQQTVSVVTTGASPTVFEGVSGLSALVAGDVVEVHGTLDASKQIVATRIERKAAGDLAGGIRTGGVLANLNATAKTFKLGALTVDFSAATLLPAGATLAEGQVVAVFADSAPGNAGAALVARAVKVARAEEGTSVGIGGRVMAYTSVADFVVSGVHVDASAATFETGTSDDLKLGAEVAVEGQVSGGVLKASKARVLKTPVDVNASLAGPVTDFVSSKSFKVRGTPVDASAAVFTGGAAADLGNGANVKVTGHVVGEQLKADTIEFLSLPSTGPVTFKGEIRDLNVQAGTFHFLGVNLKLSGEVIYVGGTAADLANGKRVEVTGTAAAAVTTGMTPTLNVTRLSFLGDLAPQVSVVAGRVDGLAGSSFKLPGVTVNIGSGTVFSGGTLADLTNGVAVLVTGTWSAQAQALVASKIEIRKPEDRPSGVSVAGAISDFTSKAAFRIGQQKVDATEAVFTDGTEVDLANGRAVEASGVLAGAEGARYVKLAKLRFLK
jgi:Domain of unknown function (DUF5666)